MNELISLETVAMSLVFTKYIKLDRQFNMILMCIYKTKTHSKPVRKRGKRYHFLHRLHNTSSSSARL